MGINILFNTYSYYITALDSTQSEGVVLIYLPYPLSPPLL